MTIVVTGTEEPVAISFVSSNGHTVGRWRAVNADAGYEVNVSRFRRGYYTVLGHLPGGDQSTGYYFNKRILNRN